MTARTFAGEVVRALRRDGFATYDPVTPPTGSDPPAMPVDKPSIKVPFDPDDLAKLDRAAAAAGLSRAAYVRAKVLDAHAPETPTPPTPPPDDNRSIASLSDDESRRVEVKAREAGCDPLEWIRKTLLEALDSTPVAAVVRGVRATQSSLRSSRPAPSRTSRCPQCGGLTMPQGHGTRACRNQGCGWKGAV